MNQRIRIVAVLGMVAVLSGCPVNPNRVPGDTEKLTEPQTGYRYYMYVPSWHNNESKWPVVVTCHGTEPFDTSWQQIMEWRALGEAYGLLVISPELRGTNSIRTLSAPDQIRRQHEDERAILNMVQKAIVSLNGDPNRVYMVGWSGGGYAVYHTGLRNPKVFRGLAIRMGNFDEQFVADVPPRIDPYQPVFVLLASEDIPGINAQVRAGFRWMRDQGMKRVTLREIPGIHQRKPKVAFTLLRDATDNFAFVRLNAIKDVGGDPLAVQFYANVDPKPSMVYWSFGDKSFSSEMNPKHRYARPGVYDVQVTIITSKTTKTERKIRLELADRQ